MQPATTTASGSHAEVPLPAAELASFAGLYWNARDAARRFVFEDGQLKLQTRPQQMTRLKAIGNRRFVPDDGSPIVVVLDANGMTAGHESGPRTIIIDTFSSQPGVMRFTRDASGSVTGFVLEAGRVRGMKFWKDIAPARGSRD